MNDTYVIPTRPLIERTMLIRHKERKLGKDMSGNELTTDGIYALSLRNS